MLNWEMFGSIFRPLKYDLSTVDLGRIELPFIQTFFWLQSILLYYQGLFFDRVYM